MKARHLLAMAFVAPASLLTAQEEPPPTFPVRSEIVVLDVVVRDERGQVVTDLRPGEITVLEDGVECPVQSLRLVRAAEAAAGRPGAAPPAGGRPGPSAPARPPTAGPPALPPARPNVVVLVFDRLGLEPASAARRAALGFAAGGFPEGTWFAVYEIDRTLRLRQGLTSDAALLAPAIEQATAAPGRAREPGTTPDADTLTKEALGAALVASGDTTGVEGADPVLAQAVLRASGVERMQADMAARMDRLADTLDRQGLGGSTLHALVAIARELAAVEGRKTLLLFSEGLHLPPALTDLLDTVVSEANRSGLALYALDARGLVAERAGDEARLALLSVRADSARTQQRRDPESRGRTEMQSPETEQSASPGEVRMHDLAEDALRLDPQANLRDLAEATGGFLVADTNDLGRGIERIGGDLREYHEVAYAPANPVADGQFRSVEVKVRRKRVSVRARRGYFALAPGQAARLEPHELALARALELAEPPSDVPHSLVARPVPGGAEVALDVPCRGLRFEEEPGRRFYRARFSALVLVRDPGGRVVSRLSHDWPLRGPSVELESARGRTASVRRTLELPSGDYVVESAVGDRLAGLLGVERTPLVVR